jgi:hypothetical protein
MIFPSVDQLVGVLRVFGSNLTVNEIFLRNVVVSGLISCQLGFNKQSIASAIPRHIPFLVFTRHQIILLTTAPIIQFVTRQK